MRIDTINALMDRLVELFGEVSFPTDKKRAQWAPQYAASLGHLEGEALDAAFRRCMNTWHKKAAPMPADILKAVSGGASGSGVKTLKEVFEQRDRALTEEKHRLVSQWLAEHPGIASLAKQEGWTGNLMHQLATGANALAQRNMIRLDPHRKPQFLEADDLEYFGIWIDRGEERLVITKANIALWQSYRSLPSAGGRNNIPSTEIPEAA